MSISSLTAVGVARNRRTPNKSDTGEVTEDSLANKEGASLGALLIKQVPTGMVAAYMAVTAATVELIDETSPEAPQPDVLLVYRWGGLIVLVIGSMVLTYLTYRSKADTGARRPVAEVLGVGVAAAGWGLVMPESPALAQASGDRGTALVLLIGFLAVVVNLIIATRLKSTTLPEGAPAETTRAP